MALNIQWQDLPDISGATHDGYSLTATPEHWVIMDPMGKRKTGSATFSRRANRWGKGGKIKANKEAAEVALWRGISADGEANGWSNDGCHLTPNHSDDLDLIEFLGPLGEDT